MSVLNHHLRLSFRGPFDENPFPLFYEVVLSTTGWIAVNKIHLDGIAAGFEGGKLGAIAGSLNDLGPQQVALGIDEHKGATDIEVRIRHVLPRFFPIISEAQPQQDV